MHRLLRQARPKKALRYAGLRLAAFAIGCQFLVPAGYMPGSLADGTPFVLCSMYTGALGQHDSHAQAAAGDMDSMHAAMPGHEQHHGSDGWQHCPQGALSASAALAFSFETTVAPGASDEISTVFVAAPRSVAVLTAHARAPPSLSLNLFV